MKKYIIMAVGALALIGVSVGASIFIIGGQQDMAAADAEAAAAAEADPPPAVTHYFEFKPEFVVNFSGSGRTKFFMAEVSVSTEDEGVLETLDMHKPELRNDLLMLFGNQDSELISTTDGKVRLRQDTLETVQSVVEKHYGSPAIKEVFFTRFVVQ